MPPRYFKNDSALSSRGAERQLKASLERLVTKYPPNEMAAGGGLYKGPISCAYTLMILQQAYPECEVQEQPIGNWSTAYLKAAQDHMAKGAYPGPKPGRCGITDDVMCLLAIAAASSQDADLAAQVCDYSAEVIDEETENEFLYGRAGYLYLLRLIKASFADKPETLQLIADTQDDVVDAILDSPRPWKWRGKAYLGAIHGAIGIITQVVLTNPTRYAPKMEMDLAVLLTYQFEGGNWPSSMPVERDRLVQVCHGAPGVIISLLSIREYFPNLHDRIDKAIARGREDIWERGLLTKEPCICHGITGNALALDDKEFEHFLTYTTGSEMKALEKDNLFEPSSAPESLFCGEAGRAWSWAVADKQLPRRILGYNEI